MAVAPTAYPERSDGEAPAERRDPRLELVHPSDLPPASPTPKPRNLTRTAGGHIGVLLMYLAEVEREEPSLDRDVRIAETRARIRKLVEHFPLIRQAVTPPEADFDPWLTEREAANRAKAVSRSGAISSEFRKTMRRLEEARLAFKQGDADNSRRLTLRSTIDAVIEYGLDEAIARLKGGA